MNKVLCVAVLLLGTIALTGRNSTAAPVGPAYPLIVAKAKLLNQTAAIPTTTIYTPAQNGLYRLSVYATMTNPPADTVWTFDFAWTDDSGSLQSGGGSLLQSNGDSTGSFLLANSTYNQMGAAVIIEAKGGTAITYDMSQSGAPDGSAYNLYYILERLE